MELQLTLHGHSRKEAAICIGMATNTMPVYRGAPLFDYKIGGIILDRQGVLRIGDADEHLQIVLEALQTAGYYTPEPAVTVQETPQPESPGCLCIQMPLEGFDPIKLDNLRRLVASKATLIKTAIGAEELPIVENGETLDFPWFTVDATADEVTAFSHLVSKLCDMAKNQARVTATERPVENMKYAFRCFLLRLNFIGPEYATSRKILLRNLSGNGSIKSDARLPQQPTTAPEPTDSTVDTDSESDGTEPEPEASDDAMPKE